MVTNITTPSFSRSLIVVLWQFLLFSCWIIHLADSLRITNYSNQTKIANGFYSVAILAASSNGGTALTLWRIRTIIICTTCHCSGGLLLLWSCTASHFFGHQVTNSIMLWDPSWPLWSRDPALDNRHNINADIHCYTCFRNQSSQINGAETIRQLISCFLKLVSEVLLMQSSDTWFTLHQPWLDVVVWRICEILYNANSV